MVHRGRRSRRRKNKENTENTEHTQPSQNARGKTLENTRKKPVNEEAPPVDKKLFTPTKRLMRDFRDLHLTEGLCTVGAAPLPSNLFEWHVNLIGSEWPYDGVLFHLIVKFPPNCK